MRIIDLCCGTKSATLPFERAGWEVVTLDNDPRWRPAILADVREWAPAGAGRFDCVWASPPCTQFSRSDQPGLYPNEQAPDLSIAEACLRIINEIEPRVWWVENVRGARRWLAPLIGRPACHLGSWWLWTNSLYLPALTERPTKRLSGYRKGRVPTVRLAVSPSVALAVYSATIANFV